MTSVAQGEVPIQDESHIVTVRTTVRDAASRMGFGITDVTRIVTAASELARNVFRYAGVGVMRWRALDDGGANGIELVFVDHGPGIADIELALREGFSSARGMGMGLPGSRRLMDDFDIQSTVGQGTTVTIRKWLRR
ncbi:MAG TPA: anti-sigma regulatory factor [Chloroflexota bacterium]|nr:anti-sigma regulatory factor [Chloroflexota bacterium]